MNAPFIHSNNSIKKYNLTIIFSLIFPILFGFYKNGILLYQKNLINFFSIFKPILLPILGYLCCYLGEYLFLKIKNKNIKFKIFDSIFALNGIFLGSLICPRVNVFIFSILVFILSFLIQFINKKLYFSESSMLCLILIIVFNLFFQIDYNNLYESKNIMEIKTSNIFLGFGPGGINASSNLFILFSYIYLCFKRLYKKESCFYYLTTFFIICLISFLFNHNLYNSFLPLFSYNTIFVGVYLLTDIRICPNRKKLKICYGVLSSLLTFLLIKIGFNFLSPVLVILILSLGIKKLDKITN